MKRHQDKSVPDDDADDDSLTILPPLHRYFIYPVFFPTPTTNGGAALFVCSRSSSFWHNDINDAC